MINITHLGKPNPFKKAKDPNHKRQVNKCTMTDVLFITLINYIRENGTNGIITLTNDDVSQHCIKVIDTKSRLLVDSGFVNDDINRSIYVDKKENTPFKKFMAQNEYNYTNNLFHKVLKFITDNDYGVFYNTYKLYNQRTRKSTILTDMYDVTILSNIKAQLFKELGLYKDDWSRYIQLVNGKSTKENIFKLTADIFNKQYEQKDTNEYIESFYNKYKLDYNIIYPAYIISVFDYEQNNIDIDNYIADKVTKLNFDKIDYVEQRSQKGIYKTTYERIKEYNSIDIIENDLEKEVYELIQNELYYDKIQQQLYKWYTLSIFDTNKKTQYINSRQQQKIINKALKEERNYHILMLKEQGLTQKEVADMLNISERTIRRYWNK